MVMSTEDLGKVLSLLRLAGQSGVLTLAPTAHPEHAAWLASGVLHEGLLLNCQVTRREDGAQLRGEQALAWLHHQPQIFWYVHPSVVVEPGVHQPDSPPPDALLAPPSVLDEHTVPRRTELGQNMPVRMIAREQRMVFALLDGRRSKVDLLRLLPARQDLDQVLEQLCEQGLITYG